MTSTASITCTISYKNCDEIPEWLRKVCGDVASQQEMKYECHVDQWIVCEDSGDLVLPDWVTHLVLIGRLHVGHGGFWSFYLSPTVRELLRVGDIIGRRRFPDGTGVLFIEKSCK